jgi:hypothetical protein
MLKSPFILAVVALISLLGVIFLASTRKKGLKTAGVVLLISGVFLIASKVALDTGFHQLEKKLATSSSESKALQESILNIAEGIEKSMTTYNMYFGIGFLVLSIISFALIRRHTGKSVPPTEHLLTKPQESFIPPSVNSIARETSGPAQAPSMAPQMKVATPASQPIKKKRPPRLVQ